MPPLRLCPKVISYVDSCATVGWHTCKSLVYSISFRFFSPGSTVNEYVRVTLVRCYHLITTWGWWRCEIILSAVFDFFAQRNLMQLDKEQGHGSSQFLENLAERPWLDVQTSDTSFQIFLKNRDDKQTFIPCNVGMLFFIKRISSQAIQRILLQNYQLICTYRILLRSQWSYMFKTYVPTPKSLIQSK